MSALARWQFARALGVVGLVALACSPAPLPRAEATLVASPRPVRAQRADPCLPRSGARPPEPLLRKYQGLARAARCQAELVVIMEDVAAALGVRCEYCHEPRDYRLDTPRKRIANWMATELSPRLAGKGQAGSVECADCHARDGKPRAKLLGAPRSESQAIEWMTTELVENFTQRDGKPLRCKTCHRENLGSSGFQRHLLLTDALSGLPKAEP